MHTQFLALSHLPGAARKAFGSRLTSACLTLCLISTHCVPAEVANYAVVVSEGTWSLPEWQDVATRLQNRHSGEVLRYSGTAFPVSLRQALAAQPRDYVCFVAQPEEVTEAFVRACHQMLRQLDSDPYTDAVWGIVTGRTASDALKLASATGPLVVRNALMKTGAWLDYFNSGVYHSEMDTGTMWTRTNGQAVIKSSDGPIDDTVPLVEALNAGNVDIMVTSGHANEFVWQLHFPTAAPEGYFIADAGQLIGQDGTGVRHAINSTNPKIHYAPGNCSVGHIPEDSSRDDCLAFGWLGTGGAVQVAGYVVTTWYGYVGWGVADYFVRLQDRFTFAESCFLIDQSLVFDLVHQTPGVDPMGLVYDRDVLVLYGDPAYEARIQPATEPDYDQTLNFTRSGTNVQYTLTIRMNRAVNVTHPVIARLPVRIANPIVTEANGRLVEAVDDMVLVQAWQDGETDLAVGQTWTIRLSGQVSGLIPPRLEQLAVLRPGVLQLAVIGAAGVTNRIEVSPDLTQWNELTNIVSSAAAVEIADPAADQSTQRFYRAVALQ